MHGPLVVGIAIKMFKNNQNEFQIEQIFSAYPKLPNVHRTTIKRWITTYQKKGDVLRKKQTGRLKKFNS